MKSEMSVSPDSLKDRFNSFPSSEYPYVYRESDIVGFIYELLTHDSGLVLFL